MLQDEPRLDWLGYGARFYDPVLGRWHGIDNKAEKYYSITPYAYATNNPILFIDPNGKEIVDAKGNKISYSEKSGWSKNATESVKIVYQALQETETGREQWNKAVSSDRKMSFELKNEVRDGKGNVVNGFCRRNFTKKEGKAFLAKESVQNIEINVVSIPTDARNKGLTLREAIAATTGHEIEHATNEENINDSEINATVGEKILPVESVPNEVGNKIREESSEQKIFQMDPKGL